MNKWENIYYGFIWLYNGNLKVYLFDKYFYNLKFILFFKVIFYYKRIYKYLIVVNVVSISKVYLYISIYIIGWRSFIYILLF